MDYERLIFRALAKQFPDEQERNQARARLEGYGSKAHHRETGRVRLGILYLVSKEPRKLDDYLKLADVDYRDLLSVAEYPYSGACRVLGKDDPDKYTKLQQQERREYESWVNSL